MPGSLDNAGLFLLNTLFNLYLFVLSVRLILAWSRANYFNPITRFVITVTQPVINPLRRFIPNIKNLETSTFLLMVVLEIIKFALIGFLFFLVPNIITLIVLSILDTVKIILSTFFYAILAQAILSWIQASNTGSPVFEILEQLTRPILRPIRRLVPPIAGIDITPIPALIVLQLLIILL
jgi:YggT family protein